VNEPGRPDDFDTLTPARIVEELDRYVVGQEKAKRAVAVALRNRARRKRLPPELREEVAPKNILMIGPTGVGKTEIARRLAKLCASPFVKVEATKYTEVGYVGRDVESMIRDLMAAGHQMVRDERRSAVAAEAERRAEERLLDLLLPGLKADDARITVVDPGSGDTREKFRGLLRSGKLDEREVEVTVSEQGPTPLGVIGGPSMDELEGALKGLAGMFGGRKKKKTVRVREARRLLEEEEADKLVDDERLAEEARSRVEQDGIVFIDEFDKIAVREGARAGGPDVSREGVQRDILPIVEGSRVTTKWGVVDTTHVLFIAAGAFNVARPQDLIPELQGRFPIRVELESLGADDFERILSEPENALVRQYKALLATEELELDFAPGAVRALAEVAARANSAAEDIGARRLHTVMERLLEEVSFDAPNLKGTKVTVDAAFVEERFRDVWKRDDLAKYIL